MFEVLKCDQCGKEEKQKEAVDWISTTREGIDATTWDEKPLSGHFCSRKCCSAYFADGKWT